MKMWTSTRFRFSGHGRVQAFAVVVAIPLWWALCWVGASIYSHRWLAEAHRTESEQANRYMASVVQGYDRIINVRAGMPRVLARDLSLRQFLSRLGPQAPGAALPKEERQRRWTQDPQMAAVGRRLKSDADDLGLASLSVTDAAGNCIAASDAGTTASHVAATYRDRDYFPEAQAGRSGYRVTIGRYSGIAGIAFFAPVLDQGRFLGLVSSRIDLAAYRYWLKPADAFLTDHNGVVLLARDSSLELHAIPGAAASALGAQDLQRLYRRSSLASLEITPWGDVDFPALERVSGRSHPVIHLTQTVASGIEPAVHVLWPFPQLLERDRIRRNATLALGATGSLLIWLTAVLLGRHEERRRTLDALSKREQQLRTLANSSPDNIMRFDTAGYCVYVNRHIVETMASKPERLLGKPIAEVDKTEGRQLTPAVLDVLATGQGTVIKIDVLDRRRERRTHEIRLVPERDEDGSLIGVLAIGRDVTELKRYEEALEAQNQLLAQHQEELEREVAERTQALTAANELLTLKSYAVNQVREAVFLIDAEARLLYVNQEACRSLGYSHWELLGMTVMDIDPSFTYELWKTTWADFHRTGGATIESLHRRKDGSIFSVEVAASHFRYRGQSYSLSLVRDITERKRMEQALEDERRLFIGGPTIAIKWKALPDWPVEYVSPNVRDRFGYAPEDFTSGSINYHGIVHPEDQDRVLAEIRACDESGAAIFEQEYRIRHAEGQYRWVHDFTVVIRNAEGVVTHYHGHLSDVTERKRSEAALRESEEKYRTLLEKIQAAVVVHGADTRILTFNPPAQAYLGLTEDQLYARTARDPGWCFLREDGSLAMPEDYPVNKVMASGRAIDNYILGIRAPGREDFWALVNANPVFGTNGEIAQVIVTFIDISARKTAEAALAAREREFRTLAESLPDNIVRYDRNSRVVYINPVLERTLGASSAAMLGTTIREHLHNAPEYENYARAVDAVIASGTSIEIEQPVAASDGDAPRIHQIRIVAERGSNGEVVGALAIGRDITEQKRMENALRTSEREFRTLAENIPDHIIRYDTKARKTYLNSATVRLMGVDASILIGKSPEETPEEAHRVAVDRFGECVRRVLRSGEPEETEFTVRHSTAGVQIHDVRFVAERDDQGNIVGALMVGRDVTQHKKVEEELERYRQHLEDLVALRTQELAQARDAAEAANRAKSAFLANMSHELRTPLNAILGFAELMERDAAIPPVQRHNLGTINRSGRHLLSLINDILEISKIEAGRLELQTTSCDLPELMEAAVEPVQLRARQQGLRLTLRLHPDVPRYISVDVGKLRQILTNLISNAVKYTERGRVDMEVQAKRHGDDDHWDIDFIVRDTGVGIAPTELENIFQPFYQTEQGARVGEGTGLGLAISRQYAALMGGRLTASSTVGQGSVFTFRLTATAASGALPSPRQRRVLGLMAGQTPKRILIAEDKVDNQRLLEQLLTQAGFETRTVSNGREAVAVFEAWQPHMIWMDMRMPIMDGYQATHHIRQLPKGREVRIAALTASAFREDRENIIAAGCDEVLAKPLDVDRLFAVMGQLLDVSFRYEEDVKSHADSPVDLTALPASLRHALYEAASRLDVEATAEAIALVRQRDPGLAGQLESLVRSYQYNRIASLCHPTEESRHG